jgi:hypothetical protein
MCTNFKSRRILGRRNAPYRSSTHARSSKRCLESSNRYSRWYKVGHSFSALPHSLISITNLETSLRLTKLALIGNRTDKKQHFSEKVTKVESILAADGGDAKKEVQPAEKKEALKLNVAEASDDR